MLTNLGFSQDSQNKCAFKKFWWTTTRKYKFILEVDWCHVDGPINRGCHGVQRGVPEPPSAAPTTCIWSEISHQRPQGWLWLQTKPAALLRLKSCICREEELLLSHCSFPEPPEDNPAKGQIPPVPPVLYQALALSLFWVQKYHMHGIMRLSLMTRNKSPFCWMHNYRY